MRPEIEKIIDPGSPNRNEDYLWIGPEEGVNAVLILDGTSGTADDFGSGDDKTGGQRYVEKFGEYVREIMKEDPERELEAIMKDSIARVWEVFKGQGEKASTSYLQGRNTTYPRSDTVPGAVGCLARWNEDELEILHIGDVETYIVKENDIDLYSNEAHEAFDGKLNEAIEKEGNESEKARELVSKHRSACNYPGTYPQIGFNPLVVEKMGKRHAYRLENVEKVVLSTDGGTTRMKKLLDKDSREVLQLIEENGVESSLETLREKERATEVSEIKQSDDAAIIEMRF